MKRTPLRRGRPLRRTGGPRRTTTPTNRNRSAVDNPAAHAALETRARGACEVRWDPGHAYATRPSRCLAGAHHRHHRLPRSRGGRILDDTGTAWHLAYLCTEHHDLAHGTIQVDRHLRTAAMLWVPIEWGGQTWRTPLMVGGTARTTAAGSVAYLGPDLLLSAIYPPETP